MKFVTAEIKGITTVGVLDSTGENVLPLNAAEQCRSGEKIFPDTLLECIQMGDSFLEKVNSLIDWEDVNSFYIPMSDVRLLAPIPRPAKNIFCVGKNYADHAIELGSAADIPEHVMVFTKAPTTVTGPDTEVQNHSGITNQLDYEGELAVVIGKEGQGISRENALEYVFGYTIINDITARDLQERHKQYFIGKSLDTSCPMGPWLVHKNELENPGNLKIQTRVNGEIRQESSTNKFIFPIEEIISVLSKGMTLEPGDIIATGTPAGVGKGFKPPKYLSGGDVIEITVEGVGILRNTISK
ncbi:fumarylacetoacetate hydrolase family protein [Neobacillus terrae]|uniref:fumarylacetoacetate hydrolase family protein n=1 Tax=Neobacillus terrae TaxID=3034837 RepID=UPI00140A7C1C|nr:fumarylacetoacetate hydrolase family protein [Neobacillus terrae]NHM31704.1 fumarylacetoacetate hydrolase family protein [Neobacillus terrae]